MKGKVAVVTGGAGGLGSAVCRAFHGEGADVAIADMDLARAEALAGEVSSSGGRCVAVEADVTSRESVYAAVEDVVRKLGRVDFLVHVAGNNLSAPVLEMSESDWRSVVDTHLTGAFLFCQAAGRQIVSQGEGGRVVLMSSVGAFTPVPERGAYSPAKAGLVALAQVLSLEWAVHGINVNAVCPGVAQTPMTKMVYERQPELRAERLKRMPMGREALPEEIADLVVFLCSDRSTYINGTAITIDGAFINSGFMPEPPSRPQPGNG